VNKRRGKKGRRRKKREGEGRNRGGEEGGRSGLNPSFPKDEET